MEVEYAFLADAADAPPSGKLYVLGGGFDQISAHSFPAVHLYMSLVVKLRLHPTECDRQHRIEIELWDQDGQSVGPKLNAEFSARRHANNPTRPVFVQLVLSAIGQQFPRPGSYDFHIVVNGQHLKTVQLYLEQVANPASTGP